jgi:hypothetical protein
METQDFTQELKSERVQEEKRRVVVDPWTVALKSERVQKPAYLTEGSTQSSSFELHLNQKQPVTIELLALQTVITLHGAGPDQAG